MKNFIFILSIFFVFISAEISAETCYWQPEAELWDILNPLAWTPQVPQSFDDAYFTSEEILSPTLPAGELFACRSFNFTTYPYILNIGPGAPPESDLTFNGGGILGSSDASDVTFNVYGGSTITFSSVFDACTAGKATYNIDEAFIEFTGSNFNTAQDAIINLSNTSACVVYSDITIGELKSSTETDSIFINTGKTLTVGARNTDATISGYFHGDGNLIKSGNGLLTLSGTNTLTGLTTVSSGTLKMIGSMAGDVTVDGGVLEGTGVFNSNVHLVSGIIAPEGVFSPIPVIRGNIGTMVVAGNYTQNPGTILEIEIDELGQSDLLQVGGTATLSGTVQVSPLGGYLIDHPYLFLQASNIIGSFSNISPSAIFDLIYDSVNPWVYLIAHATQFTNFAQTHNQQSVARQFDQLTDFPFNLAEIVFLLSELSPQDQRRALDEMSGVQYNSLMYVAQSSSNRFLQKIYYPLMQRVKNNCLPVCGDHVNVWLDMQGGKTRQHGDFNASGYHAKDWEISLGFHKCINDYTTLGFALEYEHDHVHFDTNGKANIKTGLATLFGSYHDDLFYYISELAGGYSHDKVERFIDIDPLEFRCTSKPDISQFAFNNEFGFNFNWQCFGLKPFVAVEYGYYHQSKVDEDNGHPIDLHLDTKHKNTCNGFLGLHLANVFHNQLTIGMDISWEHRFNFSKNHMHAQFIDFGESFTTISYKKYREIGHLSFDFSEQVNDNFAFNMIFSGEKAKHYHAWDVLGGISMKW